MIGTAALVRTKDLLMTKQIIEATHKLGIVVHDHIIVGKDGHASMRGLGLI